VTWLRTLPASCDVLRPYQRQQVQEIADALEQGCRKILAQAPTGAGKSHVIAAITAAASRAGLRVLIVATRTKLVRQIHERLESFGLDHGVIAASLPEMLRMNCAIQVASADTLYRRALVDERMPLLPSDIIIFDEAHLAAADSRVAIINAYPNALLVGFTATPARKSGLPLNAIFDRLILGPSTLELIAMGMLVTPRIFNVPVVSADDLKALPKDATTDYQAGELGHLMSRPKLVGDVVSNWLRIASGKRTIAFAVSKSHGAELVQEFSRAGVSAELMTDQDDEDQREAVIKRLENGETTVIVNCFLLAYGVDLPSVECIVLARPTRSLPMYLQMVGRGLRPAPGKDSCILIDHGRVVENLGLPTLDFSWSLDEGHNVNQTAREVQRRMCVSEKPRTCPECKYTWTVSEEGSRCTCCGWAPQPKQRPVATVRADLIELDDRAHPIAVHSQEASTFYTEAMAWYARRWPQRWLERPKSGRWWAWSQTRTKFEIADSVRMPGRFWEAEPANLVSPAVAGWLQHRVIRYAKQRQSA